MALSQPAPRSPAPFKTPRNPISRRQVEAVISRSIAGFGIVFGAQTVPVFLGQFSESHEGWRTIMPTTFVLALVVAVACSTLKRFVRTAHAAVAIVYLVALVSWPFAVADPIEPVENHWLYYLLTVATATAAIGFSLRVATAYLFVAPAIYMVVRITPPGGGAPWERSLLDAVYAVILGGAVLIIVTMLRQAAAAVDAAQATALQRYSTAVRQHATEVERVQVDAIVHDSVLTTLLSAARAESTEAKQLAATMAGNAIRHLTEAARTPAEGSTVSLEAVAQRIADSALAFAVAFRVSREPVADESVPAAAGESLYSAAVQAMVNSIQHAGGAGVDRWVAIRPPRSAASSDEASAAIEIEVGDAGAGFDLDDVPTERLGLRVSIVERVTNAGGAVAVDSAPGRGTVVRIEWPDGPPSAVGADAAAVATAEEHARGIPAPESVGARPEARGADS